MAIRGRRQSRSAGIGLGMAAALLTVGVALAASQLPGKALTTDPANDLRPAWSPDGKQIAFQSARQGSNDIWLMDADGGNQRALTTETSDDRRPAWSPDGAWIAFDTDRSGNRDIWVMPAQGGEQRQLTRGPGQETFAAWSPQGDRIAFFVYGGGVLELWAVGLQDFLKGGEAGSPQRLVARLEDERKNQCTFACHMPEWSPDGKEIAYTGASHTQVWVVGADGSDPHPVSGGGEHEHFPMWTSDGRILYLSERVTESQEPVNDVWVMNADGSNAQLLYAAVPHGGPLEFRPDGATIAFQSPRAGNFDIYTTVLGQATAAVEPTPLATAEVAQQPGTAPMAPAAAAAESRGGSGAIVAAGVAAVAVAAGLLAFFLVRRGRP